MEVTMDFKEIEKRIDKYIDEIIDFRRDIHSHPELSGNEKRTSEKVIEKLKAINNNRLYFITMHPSRNL